MIRRCSYLALSALIVFLAVKCVPARQTTTGDPSGRTPSAEREFRAAWVATVANVNWPSKPGLPVEQQKKEALEYLDLLYKNNFNAVIFQVRPQCDALYRSDFEPWSYYLTGKQGQAPDPFYDPLEFWINEAHKRGIELHAWLNPYRAHHIAGGEVTDASVVKTKPGLAVRLEQGWWWLEPTKKEVQDHTFSVVMDIVRRYDLDGIHFDDYFYPYPVYNGNKDFPDDESWQEYLRGGGRLSRADWRRESVDKLIERLYKAIKDEKPHVRFGLSPFGIWRPYNPPAIYSGFDQHNELYADARKWLNKGWIDYYSPQLYWPINQIPQSYPILLAWWKDQNTRGRHLWPGISLSINPVPKLVDETVNQIMVARGLLTESPGVVHWSIGPIASSKSLAKAISEGPYKRKALVPPSPWLDKKAPQPPSVDYSIDRDTFKLSWSHPDKEDISRWVVYYRIGKRWDYDIYSNSTTSGKIPAFSIDQQMLNNTDNAALLNAERLLIPLDSIAVSAVDYFGNESPLSFLKPDKITYSMAHAVDVIVERFTAEKKSNLPEPDVTPGINVLVEEQLHLIKGKRIGLITNPSAVDKQLRSSIDVLAEIPGVELAALFGAEHGVRGALQGRIFQEGEPDPRTGIPVYSMYGESFAPKKEWLQNIDVLIFDIQGVGSAWYTFKYSMSYAMQACAEAGIEFLVLDRPDPLGGRVVEGPMLDTVSIFRHSLPLRHGMTYGELAMMWNETEGYGAKLTVVKMKGWRRNMLWSETGLPWVMPSPNMGTLETALVYPGQCLFERSNISEARGTTKPFLLTGAPWVNAESAADSLNARDIAGAVFRPVYFMPLNADTLNNARNKPWNRICGGIEIILTDPAAYRSVEAAINIFDVFNKQSPDSLKWNPPPAVELLTAPEGNVRDIIKACQDETEEFMKIREKYLLYR